MHFFRTNNLTVAVISRNLESTVKRALGRGTGPTNIPSGVQSSIFSTCKDNLVQTRIQKENCTTLPISLSQINCLPTTNNNNLQNKKLLRNSFNSFLLLNQLIGPPQKSSTTLTNKIDDLSSKEIFNDLCDQILKEGKTKKEKEKKKKNKNIFTKFSELQTKKEIKNSNKIKKTQSDNLSVYDSKNK